MPPTPPGGRSLGGFLARLAAGTGIGVAVCLAIWGIALLATQGAVVAPAERPAWCGSTVDLRLQNASGQAWNGTLQIRDQRPTHGLNATLALDLPDNGTWEDAYAVADACTPRMAFALSDATGTVLWQRGFDDCPGGPIGHIVTLLPAGVESTSTCRTQDLPPPVVG